MSDVEEKGEEITSTQIKEICSKWSEVQEFIEKHHRNKVVTNWVINILNDNAISLLRKFSSKEKNSLERFLMHKPKIEPPKKVQRREK